MDGNEFRCSRNGPLHLLVHSIEFFRIYLTNYRFVVDRLPETVRVLLHTFNGFLVGSFDVLQIAKQFWRSPESYRSFVLFLLKPTSLVLLSKKKNIKKNSMVSRFCSTDVINRPWSTKNIQINIAKFYTSNSFCGRHLIQRHWYFQTFIAVLKIVGFLFFL